MPKALYQDCDRATRRRLSKAFAVAAAAERATEGVLRVPTHLYACGRCHRLVAHCICTDAAGRPLDWGVLQPEKPARATP